MDRPDETVAYDDWAPIYDVWTETAPVTKRNLPFYVNRLVAADGPAVELGVGNGRIAIEAAKRGKAVVGVDSSSVMLAVCRQRARDAGVDHALQLIRADFRDFELAEKAALIVIPFHSIGHLLSRGDKLRGLMHIRTQLQPGGELVFDHFVFDPMRAEVRDGVPALRATYVNQENGHDVLLWVASRHDLSLQTMLIVSKSEELDRHGYVLRTKVRRMPFSWMTPEQSRSLLEEAGFQIVDCFGGFDETPFTPESHEQVWVARRPR